MGFSYDTWSFQPFQSHQYSVYPGDMEKLTSRYYLLNNTPCIRNLKGGDTKKYCEISV